MPSKSKIDQTFLRIAKEISNFSNCVSFQVGCVIVKDGRPISTGYNGTPAGFINCCDRFSELSNRPRQDWTTQEREEHHCFSEAFEIHAEQNAIIYAAKHGIEIDGANIYCTLQPCNTCLKILTQSGIKRIVYAEDYDKGDYCCEVKDMVKTSGVKLEWVPLKS